MKNQRTFSIEFKRQLIEEWLSGTTRLRQLLDKQTAGSVSAEHFHPLDVFSRVSMNAWFGCLLIECGRSWEVGGCGET
jgi:hypothetical protein